MGSISCILKYRRSNTCLFLLAMTVGFISVWVSEDYGFFHFDKPKHFESIETQSFHIARSHHVGKVLGHFENILIILYSNI